VENWSVDLKAQIRAEPSAHSHRYSHVLRREPQGGGQSLLPPSLQEELGQGVGGQLKKPLFPPFGSE